MMSRVKTATNCPYCYGTEFCFPEKENGLWEQRRCDCAENVTANPPLYRASFHKPALLIYKDRAAWVDEGIIDEIELMWHYDIWTTYSCQGGEGIRNCGIPGVATTGARYITTSTAPTKQVLHILPWVKRVEDWYGGMFISSNE